MLVFFAYTMSKSYVRKIMIIFIAVTSACSSVTMIHCNVNVELITVILSASLFASQHRPHGWQHECNSEFYKSRCLCLLLWSWYSCPLQQGGVDVVFLGYLTLHEMITWILFDWPLWTIMELWFSLSPASWCTGWTHSLCCLQLLCVCEWLP